MFRLRQSCGTGQRSQEDKRCSNFVAGSWVRREQTQPSCSYLLDRLGYVVAIFVTQMINLGASTGGGVRLKMCQLWDLLVVFCVYWTELEVVLAGISVLVVAGERGSIYVVAKQKADSVGQSPHLTDHREGGTVATRGVSGEDKMSLRRFVVIALCPCMIRVIRYRCCLLVCPTLDFEVFVMSSLSLYPSIYMGMVGGTCGGVSKVTGFDSGKREKSAA